MRKQIMIVVGVFILIIVFLFPSTRECPKGPCMPRPDEAGRYSLYYNTKPLIFRILNIDVNYSEGTNEYKLKYMNNEK